jgi:hypothetical protein
VKFYLELGDPNIWPWEYQKVRGELKTYGTIQPTFASPFEVSLVLGHASIRLELFSSNDNLAVQMIHALT